jgi:hypothetical protein
MVKLFRLVPTRTLKVLNRTKKKKKEKEKGKSSTANATQRKFTGCEALTE